VFYVSGVEARRASRGFVKQGACCIAVGKHCRSRQFLACCFGIRDSAGASTGTTEKKGKSRRDEGSLVARIDPATIAKYFTKYQLCRRTSSVSLSIRPLLLHDNSATFHHTLGFSDINFFAFLRRPTTRRVWQPRATRSHHQMPSESPTSITDAG